MSNHIEPIFIAQVADNNDPEKSERIRYRSTDESNVPVEKLPWIDRLYTQADFHQLPEVGELILIVTFLRKKFWLEVVDIDVLKQLGDDDYIDGFIQQHRDVFSKIYAQSKGWTIKYKGNIETETDFEHVVKEDGSITRTITADTFEITHSNLNVKSDGNTVTIKLSNAIIESDGNKVKIEVSGIDFGNTLQALLDAMMQETHMTGTGQSSPPLPPALTTYSEVKTKLGTIFGT